MYHEKLFFYRAHKFLPVYRLCYITQITFWEMTAMHFFCECSKQLGRNCMCIRILDLWNCASGYRGLRIQCTSPTDHFLLFYFLTTITFFWHLDWQQKKKKKKKFTFCVSQGGKSRITRNKGVSKWSLQVIFEWTLISSKPWHLGN